MKPIDLPGTPVNAQPLRQCRDCETEQPPEGGVQLNPARRVCYRCWNKFWRRK